MKPTVKHSNKRAAFTIVELLTVMSIIIILIGLLVPGLNMVKRFARRVVQKNQFKSINTEVELFNNEWDGYPDSSAQDADGNPYCGAMKLCEAMVGQDLVGFHLDSLFREDGLDGPGGNALYPTDPPEENLRSRKLYLPGESANAYRLNNIYGTGNTTPFSGRLFVLCDVYNRVTNRGTAGSRRIGMPVLYYKANISGTKHDSNDFAEPEHNIYNYLDNDELVKLAAPWDATLVHPIVSTETPEKFYEMTKNDQVTTMGRPFRADSFILISAGFDGLYGTRDDVFNF